MGFFKGQSGGGTWSVITMGLPAEAAEDVPSIDPETYSILGVHLLSPDYNFFTTLFWLIIT
jgi:hypothetical protein